MLRHLEVQRNERAGQRRRRVLSIAIGISLAAHLLLLIYFSFLYRAGVVEGDGPAAAFEFAMVFDEPLSDLDVLDEDFGIDESIDLSDLALDEAMLALEAQDAAFDLSPTSPGEIATLGGTAEGATESFAFSGGGGTSYFGIGAQGNRIAYIVDRSGSMGVRQRMEIATRELIRSIESLPDYAYFYILFFSSDLVEPPMQRGWTQARPSHVRQFTRYLESVSPGGGTVPAPAFHKVFSLDVRPDVIFFMTDGIITGFTAADVAAMNNRGQRVVIHTIAFGDQGSEELLRQIAADSGGEYRYVPDGGF